MGKFDYFDLKYSDIFIYYYFSSVALSGVIAGGLAYFNKVRREQTHANYGRLNRREGGDEIEMQPFVSNQQLGRDANDTSSTLVAPPSQETTLNFSNQGYKSASSSGLSTDTDEFRSFNETVKANSSVPSPAPSPVPSPVPSRVPSPVPSPSSSSKSERAARPESPPPTEQAEQLTPSTEPVPPTTPPSTVPAVPTDSSPRLGSPPQSSSTPIVDRIKNIARKKQRKRTSQSDPTRIMPRRAAKKDVNYKE